MQVMRIILSARPVGTRSTRSAFAAALASNSAEARVDESQRFYLPLYGSRSLLEPLTVEGPRSLAIAQLSRAGPSQWSRAGSSESTASCLLEYPCAEPRNEDLTFLLGGGGRK